MSADGVLVVGYGNVLRGDDGLGCHIAELLGDDARFAGARVLARHQLTPELAADVGAARLVVLVDARVDGGAPGAVRVDPVESAHASAAHGSHAVDARDLVALSRDLYGRVPPVVAVSVRAERLALGDELSPAVAAAVPQVIDTIVGLVEEASS